MTDILKQLAATPCSWRGIPFPITAREFGFSQETEGIRYVFRDDKLLESIGRENPTYRYTIPFREDLARGPWKNMFTQVYPGFLKACLDRTDGELLDPVHGRRTVKCASLRETLDTSKRDGVDVEVEFIVSPAEVPAEDEIASSLKTLEGAKGLQGLLDRQATELDAETKAAIAKIQKDSEFGRVNPFDFATSALNQIEVNQNKVKASFGDVAFRMGKLSDAIGTAQKNGTAKPSAQAMRQNARALQLAALDLAKAPLGSNKSRSRIVRTYLVTSDIGKIALAGKLGNSIKELIQLNPSIASQSVVPKDTTVAYYGS